MTFSCVAMSSTTKRAKVAVAVAVEGHTEVPVAQYTGDGREEHVK